MNSKQWYKEVTGELEMLESVINFYEKFGIQFPSSQEDALLLLKDSLEKLKNRLSAAREE